MSIPVRSVVWALSLGAAISAIGPLAARPAPRSIAPTADAQNSVTFNRDIAPIIFHSCSTCHRPGESGPFSLLTYYDVKKHARQIAEVTQSRFMPPWLPDPQELNSRRTAIDGSADRLDSAWVEKARSRAAPAIFRRLRSSSKVGGWASRT